MFVMGIRFAIRSQKQLKPDEQVFGRKGKYINGPCILKEVAIIDAFLHENFPHVRMEHKLNQVYPACQNCKKHML